jgi:hypothetical protein
MRKFLAAGAFLVLCASFCRLDAAHVVPVGDFRFLGGQYFFNSSASSLSGNLSLTVVPAVKFNDRFSIIPTYMGSYRGTKEVADLVGGGTLFQDGQDHFLSVKGVYAVTPALKLKLGTSYRLELLRETKDEAWGKGLFDYQKLNAGFETEYAYLRNGAIRAGIDYYTLRFPNYQSLESSVTSSGLGRELAGSDTLNCANLMGTLRFINSFGRLKTEVGYYTTAKSYPDQPLVLADSTLSKNKRNDSYTAIDTNVTCPVKTSPSLGIVVSLDAQYVLNDSNQAHYDAQKTKFIADYYDYSYLVVAPTVHFIIGKRPWAVSLGGSVNRQDYAKRPVQDADGTYQSGAITVDETMVSVGIAYPIGKNIKLRAVSNFIDSRSNMKYETTYAYNYQTSNYLLGFNYEF